MPDRPFTLCTLGLLLAWLPATQAAEDNLYFAGTLVDEPCTLSPADESKELDFQGVIDKELYLNGRSRGRPIVLRLLNCDSEMGKTGVSLTFSGEQSGPLPGLLALRGGGAEGVAIGLETQAGQSLPLNQVHTMGAFGSGDNLLSFMAYLQGEPDALKNRTLGLGSIEASLTFALSYD